MFHDGKLLLDSARLEDIERLNGVGAIVGVTTNPSLMAKTEKGDYVEKLLQISKFLSKEEHLSVEVITLHRPTMINQGIDLYTKLKDFVDVHIKIPVTIDNLSVISSLSRMGIKVNATACMTAVQAKMAADAGAKIVSFFYNRMIDGGNFYPEDEVSKFSNYSDDVKIICGSIRSPRDVLNCWHAGSNYVTAGMGVIEKLLYHSETDRAINGFQKDIDAWLNE